MRKLAATAEVGCPVHESRIMNIQKWKGMSDRLFVNGVVTVITDDYEKK